MKKHIDRFLWNLKNLFNKKPNPMAHTEGDTAIEDIWHSAVNLPVEYFRLKGVRDPQLWGKALFFSLVVLLVLLLL